MSASKRANRSSRLNPSTLNITNNYNRFDLPFLRKENGKVYNGEFEVTDASEKLCGVFDGSEDIKLINYLVNRPLPPELLYWQEPPNVHPDSIDMEDFYADILQHSINGVWVDGEYFNPFFIYFLNIFVFPVYKLDEEGRPMEDFESGHPFYCNIDRYVFDVAWKAVLLRHDISMMGGRGIGKSFIVDSIIDWFYRLFPGSHCIVSSTNEEMTNEAWRKVDECMESIEKLHKSLKHKRIDGGDNESLIQSGETIILADGTSESRGYLSKIEKVLYGIRPGKTRGKRPDFQHIEEFAAFPPSHQKGALKRCIAESRGSWYVGGSIKKCIAFYTGTGGSVENDEAKDVFLKPTAYEIEPTYDWGEECGIFIPTHLKRSGTWEVTGCPDISLASEQVDKERLAAMGDPQKYTSLIQEFPKTLKEVFMRSGSNIFNQTKLADQRVRLLDKNDPNVIIPETGYLNWVKDESGRITGVVWDPSRNGDISIIEHPYWLTTTNDKERGLKLKDLYVAGCDSIDQGNNDSAHAVGKIKGSELAMLVKKRVLDGAYFSSSSNIYVAKYKKRSDDVRHDHDNALKLAVYFNCLVNIEFTKIGIVSHFRARGYYHLLMKRPTIARGDADASKASNLIGTQASTPVIDHQDNKIKEYIEDNYTCMFFDDQLEQLQEYNREDRTKYDLAIATGLCELADEDKIGQLVKKVEKTTDYFKPIGYFTDSEGVKRYGVLPGKDKDGDSKDAMLQREIASQRKARKEFDDHGSMRWIDTGDQLYGI